MTKILGKNLKNIPWQDKPEGFEGVIWRHEGNPIINWNPTKSTARIFNSAVLPYEDGFIGIFRADHKNGRPQLHVGRSEDGLKWDIDDEEIKWVDEEENPFIPFNRNGVLFPRKVNDKYLLLSRPSDSGHTPFGDIFLSESPDLVHWGKHRRVMSRGGSGWWQGTKIGGGATPIDTSEGWLMFYHGVSGTCNGYVYSMGAVILDKENPSKVLYRTRDYLLTPEKEYETVGFVPNVAFPCATLQDAETGRIAIYYGAADTYVAVAYTQVDELVKYIKENSELVYGDDIEFR